MPAPLHLGFETTPVKVHIVAALAEKSVATPAYYPMMVNGMVLAANQKALRHHADES